jgi:predicted GNAT family acetyltransferase
VSRGLRGGRSAGAADAAMPDLDEATPAGELRVVDNPVERRYEALVGDQLAGMAEYRRAGNRVIFTHTETDPDFAGKGVASRLARGALDDVRARGLVFTPKCPFIAAYVQRHPAYKDLLVSVEDLRRNRDPHS